MNPYANFDFEKTPAVLDRIASKYDEGSPQYQALMAGKQALLLLGPDAAKDYAKKAHEAYNFFQSHNESLDRPATQTELDRLAHLAPYADPEVLHYQPTEEELKKGIGLGPDDDREDD